jgi:hypothetical protein
MVRATKSDGRSVDADTPEELEEKLRQLESG